MKMKYLRFKWIAVCVMFGATVGLGAEPDLSLGLELYGKGIDEDYKRGQRLGTEVEGRLTHQFNPTISLKARVRLTAEVGGNQAAFTEDYSPKQELALREAKLEWHPWQPFTLMAGAIHQDDWAGKIFLDDQAFPGVREYVRIPISDFYVSLGAQQAIANTPVVTFGTPVPSEGYPFYFMERIGFGWVTESAEIEMHGSHFSFEKLPSSAAFDSRYYGNTVVGTSNTDAAFAYNYQGFEGGVNGKFRVTTWLQPGFTFQALVNTAASRNTSYVAAISNQVEVDPTVTLTPSVFVFQMGQDASPAIYSSSDWGHNNRRGYGFALDAELVRDRIEIGAQGVRAPTIAANPFQADWFFFNVYFRTRYDLL
jgi:hypothetical protein